MTYNQLDSLSIDDLEHGIQLSLNNAEDMIAEGDLLLKNDKFPRAYTLYQLAAEEIGKSRLLFSLIVDLKCGNAINYKNYNKEFTNHQLKSKGAIVFEMAVLLVMHSSKDQNKEQKIEDFNKAYRELLQEEEKIEELNANKNNSLYVSIINEKFVSPKQMITNEMALTLRTNALIRIEASKTILKGMLHDIDKIVVGLKEIENDPNYKVSETFASFFKEKN